jgi:hypothetical protein
MVYELKILKEKDAKWQDLAVKKIQKMNAMDLYKIEVQIGNLDVPKAIQVKMG